MFWDSKRRRTSRPGLAALTVLLVLGLVVIYLASETASFAGTEKWAIQERYAQMRAESLKGPKPSPTLDRPQSSPDEAWPVGIFEEGQAPFPASAITVKNQWQAMEGGHYVQVYAGFLPNDPKQGVIVVSVTSSALEPMNTFWLPTPSKAGAVRIAKAENLQLTLEAASGTSIVFDVPSRSFMKPSR